METEENKVEQTEPLEAQEEQPEQAQEPENSQKKYDDADVDRIINRKFAEWQKKQEKKVSEAAKLASMSEAERAESERKALEEKLNDLMAKNARSELAAEARKILECQGVNAPADVLEVLVSDDAEKTNAAVSAYAQAYKASVDAGIKEALKSSAPRKAARPASGKTKEEIMAIRDPVQRQREILNNMELFNS